MTIIEYSRSLAATMQYIQQATAYLQEIYSIIQDIKENYTYLDDNGDEIISPMAFIKYQDIRSDIIECLNMNSKMLKTCIARVSGAFLKKNKDFMDAEIDLANSVFSGKKSTIQGLDILLTEVFEVSDEEITEKMEEIELLCMEYQMALESL